MSKNTFNIYENDNRRQAHHDLIIFNLEVFKSAYVIHNLQKLEAYVISHDKGSLDNQNFIFKLILSHLVDMIKISIFFENYAKAELILKGFLVHLIDSKSHPKLFEQQRKRPISIEEFHLKDPFIIDNNNLTINHNSLKVQTITFSTIIKEKDYNSVVGLPKSILKTLGQFNSERNMLHLRDEVVASISMEYVQKLKELNLFADQLLK